MTEKLCPKCEIIKPASSFYVSKKRPDGLSSYCRQCQVTDTKSRYSAHPRWRAPEGQKWCPGCQSIKPKDDFGKNKSSHDGLQARCKPCAVATVLKWRQKNPESHRANSKRWRDKFPERHADNNARWRYGIEHGTYAKMLEAQGGKCAICETTEPGGGAKRFHIDHCHNTGVVRGLLCTHCNNGIGRFRHNPDLILSAVAYLDKHKPL